MNEWNPPRELSTVVIENEGDLRILIEDRGVTKEGTRKYTEIKVEEGEDYSTYSGVSEGERVNIAYGCNSCNHIFIKKPVEGEYQCNHCEILKNVK